MDDHRDGRGPAHRPGVARIRLPKRDRRWRRSSTAGQDEGPVRDDHDLLYDALNRLTSATKAGIISDWGYHNDGNRTKATRTGTPTDYSAYNGADQLCWSVATTGNNCRGDSVR